MEHTLTDNRTIKILLGFSVVTLSMTYLCLFRIPDRVVGLGWITLWLASLPLVMSSLAVFLMYRAKSFRFYGMGWIAIAISLTTLLCLNSTRWSSVVYSFIFIVYFGIKFPNDSEIHSN